MVEFEVIPESALRSKTIEFILGMHLCQTINVIQRQNRIIKGVVFLYSQEAPLSQDIVINLTNDGIKLYFDPQNQRLKMIEVYDLSKITLRYCSNIFSLPNEKATVEKIEQSFGATHPGVYDASQQMYILSWRGLSFSFPAESNVQPHYAHGLSSLQFPNSALPVVSKLSIFAGNNLNDPKAPEMPLTCYNGNCHLDLVEILREHDRTLGLAVTMTSESFGFGRFSDVRQENFRRVVKFGDSNEEVLSAFGCPSRVFYKSEDKMKIHLPSSQRLRRSEHSDYFYNYFTLGLDVLFDAETNQAKKFVLHTNHPGHYDFGIYFRCNFKLILEGESYFEPTEFDGDKNKSITVTTFTKWEDICDLVCGEPLDLFSRQSDQTHISQQSPVVLNRAGTNNSANPFGSTFCYGYQDVIFEVMANNHIASVMLFDAAGQPKSDAS